MEWSHSHDLSPLDFFFSGMLKDKVYSVITDLMHSTQRIRDRCAKIEGDKILLHQVHDNFVNRIIICIPNDGKYIDDI